MKAAIWSRRSYSTQPSNGPQALFFLRGVLLQQFGDDGVLVLQPLLQFGHLALMLPLDGLASVLERQVRLGEKLLLPGIEDIGVDGKFGADGGDGDAVLEVAKNRLGLLL